MILLWIFPLHFDWSTPCNYFISHGPLQVCEKSRFSRTRQLSRKTAHAVTLSCTRFFVRETMTAAKICKNRKILSRRQLREKYDSPISISGRNYVQIFSAVVRSVLKKQVFKFWPWRPCLRIFFKRTLCYTVPCRSCLVVPTYHKKKFGKSRISAGEIPKLLRQDSVANPIHSNGYSIRSLGCGSDIME